MTVQFIDGAALAAFLPEWKRGIELSWRWPILVAAALDGREDRTGLGNAPEAAQTWQLVPTEDNAERTARDEILRAALDAGRATAPCFARPGYVAMVAPDGMGLTLEQTRWPWAAGDWALVFDHDDQPQARQVQGVVHGDAGVSVGLSLSGAPLPADLPTGAAVYPLLFGRLELLLDKRGAEVCRLNVSAWRVSAPLTEWEYYQGAPVALEPLARAATEIENWSQPAISTEGAARRGFALRAPLADEEELADAETFFAALDGGRLPFWLPESDPAASIAAAAPNPAGDPAARFFVKAEAQALEPGAFLWFTHPTKPPMAGRVASVGAGPDLQTALVVLDTPLANAPDADWDVFRLRLVRLNGDALRVTRWADDRGALRLEVLEVVSPGADEQGDATLRLAYLYQFQNRRGESAVWRFTGHDVALTLAGETYAPAGISHRFMEAATSGNPRFENSNFKCGGTNYWDSRRERDNSISGWEQGITVENAAAPGRPLDLQFLVDSIEGLVVLTVQRMDLSAPEPAATAEVVFCGQAARVQRIGARLEADAWPSAGLLEEKAAATGFLIGAPCNHTFCGTGCGLEDAAWSVAGAVGMAAGAQLTLAVDPGKPPGWFTGGRVVVGAGADAETRTILANDAGGAFLLNAPLRRALPGMALTARAGCLHLPADCQGRFANFVNYGGHPLVARG